MEGKEKNGAVWVKKLRRGEVLMAKLQEEETGLVAYTMSFSARQPVMPEEVEKALRGLYRKVPNLRVCISEKEGELWFKELDKETIDFEVSSSDKEEVTQFLHTHSYPHEGPLWRARLVPVAKPSYHPHNLASFHHDLHHTFPHCYHLLFGFSHVIGDGHTYNAICAAFSHILDRVLSGEEVDEEQIGSFVVNEEYDREEEECIAKFFTDEAIKEECIKEMNEGRPKLPLLSMILSDYKSQSKKTLLYTQTLDEETTTVLREKCRAAKLTVSSCMAAAGNLALAELLEERGVVQDTYAISNTHLINLRRTWPKGTAEHALCMCISKTLLQFFPTPRAALQGNQFWLYAKNIHTKFSQLLQDDLLVQKCAFFTWCYLANATHHLQTDLTYNTRGDLTRRFQGTKQFTVTRLVCSTAVHNTDIPWDTIFGTVRGRLSHTVMYNTSLINQDIAVRYGDLVHRHLVKAATL